MKNYMNKRRVFVLSIGFTVILVTFIVIVVFLLRDILTGSPDTLDKKLIIPSYLFFVFPIILEELSLLRSVYKLIIFNPKTATKISYIISAFIILVALIFQTLVFSGIITKDIFQDGPKAASSRLYELLLLTEWPVILVSFALGSIS